MHAVADETRTAAPNGTPGERTGQDDGRSNDRSRRGQRKASGRKQDREGHSAAEWVTLAFSSAIVLGLIALTTYFYVVASTDPVMVEVEPRIAEVYRAGDRFYLPVTVRNRGGETGEEVRVRVTLTGADGRQETADLMVQFLAGGGTSRTVVAFANDPRNGQIEAGVTSYLEP